MNGARHARSRETASSTLYKELNTTGYADIVVSYYYRVMDALEADDVVVLEWTPDRTATIPVWTAIASYGPAPESTPTLVTHAPLPADANNNPNFALRFRVTLPSTTDDFRLDDVIVSGTPMTPPAPFSVSMIGSVPPQCADGSDNDGNGAADYPRDTGCNDSLDNNESGGVLNIPIESVPRPPQVEEPQQNVGVILGATTEDLPLVSECVSTGPYLRDYLRMDGANNREQVELLQQFLNEEMQANIPITGFFGPITTKWVKAFQKKYYSEILQPWIDAGYNIHALENGTGYVYKTTRRHINLLKCPELNIPMPELIPGS